MDPNACLSAIRNAILALDAPQNAEDLKTHAAELADNVWALDEWMERGGCLPSAWMTR